jgi:hypothetical protein
LKLDPLNCYKTYLALKNHFTKPNYDYQKYCGKVKASLQAFYKRKDRMWFEKMSRQKTDEEIINFFVANFVCCDDPQSLWIGEIIREGETRYKNWKKKTESISYVFKEEVNEVFTSNNFQEMFEIKSNRHPQILKEYLQGKLSLETMVILNNILNYRNDFDQKLQDPIWEFVSMRILKYSTFIHTDVFKFKKILKECVL